MDLPSSETFGTIHGGVMTSIARALVWLVACGIITATSPVPSHAGTIDDLDPARPGPDDPKGAQGRARPEEDGPSTEEVRFRSGEDTLSGVLVLPGTPGPHPAIALVFGSGATDRTYHGVAPHLWRDF